MKKIKGFLRYLKQEIAYTFTRKNFYLEKDWDKFWSRDKDQFRNRFNIIVALLKKQLKKTRSDSFHVADIGAGGGELLSFLLSLNLINHDSVGVDSSAVSVASIKKIGLKALQDDVTSEQFSLPGNYDFIIIANWQFF